MAEQDLVRRANSAFYRAIESLEVERMEPVWLQAAHIVCIHPGWRALRGWGPVMQSWERIFESTFEMNFELTEIQLTVRGDLAIMVVQENLTQRDYDGASRASVLATNVFERVGEDWKLVLHHGSPIAIASSGEPPVQ